MSKDCPIIVDEEFEEEPFCYQAKTLFKNLQNNLPSEFDQLFCKELLEFHGQEN